MFLIIPDLHDKSEFLSIDWDPHHSSYVGWGTMMSLQRGQRLQCDVLLRLLTTEHTLSLPLSLTHTHTLTVTAEFSPAAL